MNLIDPSSVPTLPPLLQLQPVPISRHSQLLWLQITLSGRFSAAQVQSWHQRLQAHLHRLGLIAAISPQRIAIWRMGTALSPFDRGMVIGWLIAQPEVVLVRIARRPVSAAAAQRPSAIQTLTQEMNHD